MANQDAQRQLERQEDLERIDLESKPQIRVSIEKGRRQWGPMAVQTLFLTAQNVGRIPVYLDSPMIHTPNDHYLHFALDSTIDISNWEIVRYSSITFPMLLQPTQSCNVQPNCNSIEENIAEDFAGSTEIVGVYRDGASNFYKSDPYPINLDQPSGTDVASR